MNWPNSASKNKVDGDSLIFPITFETSKTNVEDLCNGIVQAVSDFTTVPTSEFNCIEVKGLKILNFRNLYLKPLKFESNSEIS